jgi:hypothetical protein
MTAADRLHAALTPVNVSLVAVGIVVGTVTGIATADRPVIQAPHECTVALNAADRIFVAKENAGIALHLRATRGRSEFAEHDAEVSEQWRIQDELVPVYGDAKATCLGAAR